MMISNSTSMHNCTCQPPTENADKLNYLAITPLFITTAALGSKYVYMGINKLFSQSNDKPSKKIEIVSKAYEGNILSNSAKLIAPFKMFCDKVGIIPIFVLPIFCVVVVGTNAFRAICPLYKQIKNLSLNCRTVLYVANRVEKIVQNTWSEVVAFKLLYDTLLMFVVPEYVLLLTMAGATAYYIEKDRREHDPELRRQEKLSLNVSTD